MLCMFICIRVFCFLFTLQAYCPSLWCKRSAVSLYLIITCFTLHRFNVCTGQRHQYLADEFFRSSDLKARGRLRSALSSLIVRSTRLSMGDPALPVAAILVWNKLPHHVTSTPSLRIFSSRLKTHLLSRSFPNYL